MKEYHKIQTVFKRDSETKFKTLLENEYSLPEFEYLKNNEWVFTEKVDGTNIRIMIHEDRIEFGGRTDNTQVPTFLFTKLQELFTLDKCKKVFDSFPVCLYGEGYGAKIQKGGGNYINDGCSFVLFDVKIGDWWLKRLNVLEISEKLDANVVPRIGYGSLDDMVKLCKEGFNSQWGSFCAEGIVARPDIELFANNGKRIITKLKCKDFKEK